MSRMIRVAATGLVLALVWPLSASAQPGRRAVAEGNQLYDEGRYDEAHERYLEALREAPDSPVAPFNDGNALYRTDELERAMDAYRQAAESGDPAVDARAWYNLGNALFRQQQLEPALDAYKQALRRDPTDADAKHNLELAIEQLQQQEQQQPQDGDDQDQPEQDQQEQQDQPERDQQGQDQQEQQDRQDASSSEDQNQEDSQNQQDEPQNGSQDRPDEQDSTPENAAEPPPAENVPGELSREEAERLLDAIAEDPSQVQRQRRSTTPTRPVRRPW